MKKINQYFYGGCIAFTIINIITIVMHLINNQETFRVKSQINLIFIIFLVQAVLYFTENIQIKSPIIHIALEFLITLIISFSIGIPTKYIEVISTNSIIEITIIITIVYTITFLILYKNIKSDADDINKKILENK